MTQPIAKKKMSAGRTIIIIARLRLGLIFKVIN